MEKKTRRISSNTWILLIAFIPVYLSTANGSLFNRHNMEAKEALDPYLHAITICGLLFVTGLGLWRFFKKDE